MFPVGWLMTFLLWGFFMVFFKPEKKTIPGLREKARQLSAELGPLTRNEIKAAVIVGACILVMAAKQFLPALAPIFVWVLTNRRLVEQFVGWGADQMKNGGTDEL